MTYRLSEGEREMLEMLVEMEGSLSAITFKATFHEAEEARAIVAGYVRKDHGKYVITPKGRAALSPSISNGG